MFKGDWTKTFLILSSRCFIGSLSTTLVKSANMKGQGETNQFKLRCLVYSHELISKR